VQKKKLIDPKAKNELGKNNRKNGGEVLIKKTKPTGSSLDKNHALLGGD